MKKILYPIIVIAFLGSLAFKHFFYFDSITHLFEKKVSEEVEDFLAKELKRLLEWIKFREYFEDSGDYYVFKNKLFIDLYINSDKHFAYTKLLLVSKKLSLEEKRLLIRTSQCLNLNQYLQLGNILFEYGNLDLLATYIYPAPRFGYIIQDNHIRDDVSYFLNKVSMAYPALQEISSRKFNEVQSSSVKELIVFGEDLPRLKCR